MTAYDDITNTNLINNDECRIIPEKTKEAIVARDKEWVGLSNAQDDYIKLLGDELEEIIPFMAVHNWKSTRHKRGIELRAKIAQLKKEVRP